MKYPIPILLLSCFCVAGCGPTDEEQAQQQERERQLQSQQQAATDVPYNFRIEMDSVLTRYFALKDSFSNSNQDLQKSARNLSAFTHEVVDEVLKTKDQGLWLAIARIVRTETDNLLAEDEIENQQIYFNRISKAVIQIAESFNPVEYPLYHQQCDPENGRELNWLSREEEIQNPYVGEEMDNCGEIAEKF